MNPPFAFPTIDILSRRFLERFEPRQRGHIANLFLAPVGMGMTEPHRIVSAVRQGLLKQSVKCKRWGNLATVQRNEHIIQRIDAHFSEALDYARWAIQWDRLSYPEKQRVKAERWMAQQPATERQTKYLRSLGYDGEVESKLHASELIDRLLKEGRNFV